MTLTREAKKLCEERATPIEMVLGGGYDGQQCIGIHVSRSLAHLTDALLLGARERLTAFWHSLLFFENEFNAAALRSRLRPATLCLAQMPSLRVFRLGMYGVGTA